MVIIEHRIQDDYEQNIENYSIAGRNWWSASDYRTLR
jgi:hypothetical protein